MPMNTDRPCLNPFSAEVEALLRTAGWYPGRKVPYNPPATWDGPLPVHGCAIQVLEEFGGLVIPCKNPWKKHRFPFSLIMSDYRDPDCPDVLGAIYMSEPEYPCNKPFIDFYNDAAGGNWVYIATIECSDGVYIDENGRVIMYNEYWASSWTSFVERILTGKPREEPPAGWPKEWPIQDF